MQFSQKIDSSRPPQAERQEFLARDLHALVGRQPDNEDTMHSTITLDGCSAHAAYLKEQNNCRHSLDPIYVLLRLLHWSSAPFCRQSLSTSSLQLVW